jgi:hypothetical protein
MSISASPSILCDSYIVSSLKCHKMKVCLDHPHSSSFISSFKMVYSYPVSEIPFFIQLPPAVVILYISPLSLISHILFSHLQLPSPLSPFCFSPPPGSIFSARLPPSPLFFALPCCLSPAAMVSRAAARGSVGAAERRVHRSIDAAHGLAAPCRLLLVSPLTGAGWITTTAYHSEAGTRRHQRPPSFPPSPRRSRDTTTTTSGGEARRPHVRGGPGGRSGRGGRADEVAERRRARARARAWQGMAVVLPSSRAQRIFADAPPHEPWPPHNSGAGAARAPWCQGGGGGVVFVGSSGSGAEVE